MKRSLLGISAILILAILATASLLIPKALMPADSASSAWLPASSLPTHYDINNVLTWYWTDGTKIYCMGGTIQRELKDVDVDTFEFSALYAYARDKNHVFYGDEILPGVDPATFEVLDTTYAKDATHVYTQGNQLIEGADAATFTSVPVSQFQGPYGKDRAHVYWLTHTLPKADPATFTVSDEGIHDKNWIYQNDGLFGPVSLITDNRRYAGALPGDCTKAGNGHDPIVPSSYPELFSENLRVIGYVSSDATCVIDKGSGTAQYFEYGTDQGAELSKDGSRLYFMKYMSEGQAVNGEECPSCGKYAIDRITGVINKVQ